MTSLEIAGVAEQQGLEQYLERLVGLDNRAAVRLQAGGSVVGVWSGPPFEVVALRPVALTTPAHVDVTVSAQRLLERTREASTVEVPPAVSGPSWVGLLPPRSGWEERMRGDVANVRSAVDTAKLFFRERADGVTDRTTLEQIAQDVWERTCLGEVPVRSAHAAESLGLMGPGDGAAVAYATDTWTRLTVPGGSVSSRRGLLPSVSVFVLL
ncbi:MAG: hypothetical protein LH630_10430 [Actinomycetia bacterium]|nr:hypothetical protein [Actinomycetes bacterium]